jgi:hypothetical protein
VLYLYDLLQPVIEEIHLQVERPAGHILVKVIEVRVVLHVLKTGFPAVMLSEHFGEGGLTGSNVAGYCHMLDFFLLSDDCMVY